jgi:hypothetical protein
MLALAMTAAIVAGDHVALRAEPARTAAQQAVLWKGDWLEVRGKRKGWLEVYDHRRERRGWIAAKNARAIDLDDAAAAPQLRAVVDFLRDAPGQESLGIAYAALYLKVAPKGGIDAAIMTSIGVMADRLAHRASSTADGSAADELEVAQSWGIGFASLEDPTQGSGGDGAARICYDGAAFRQALALGPSPDDAATAALALTDPACAVPAPSATTRRVQAEAALALLEPIDPTRVAGPAGDAIRIRRATLGAVLAWAYARGGDLAKAQQSADAAVSAWARVDKSELADDDAAAYQDAALAIAASRWASIPTLAGPTDGAAPALALAPGEPGETCVTVTVGRGASPAKCTHGQVWTSSFRIAPGKAAAAVAVEPLPGWLELWIFRKGGDGGWMVDVLAPDTDGPDTGYVELAGWSPDHARALIVREAREDGAVRRTFEVVTVGTLAVEKQATTLGGLGAARAWATPDWRSRTVALR